MTPAALADDLRRRHFWLCAHRTRLPSRRAGEDETAFSNSKVLAARLEPDVSYVLRSGGGSPLERPADQVQRDVQQGCMSLEAAARDYGVVLETTSLEVDREQTAGCRTRASADQATA